MKYVQKLVLVPLERWEKNKRQYSCERSVSEISFSDECFSSSSSEKEEDSYFSDEESEKTRKVWGLVCSRKKL